MTTMRGAIDEATGEHVAGWLHSEAGPIRGHTVIALVDDVCVGAGSVDVYRPDLADAGLGDGYLGFDFGVTLTRPGDETRIVVKLDGSDLVLLQPNARVGHGESLSGLALFSVRSPKSLEWMRGRGWLEQMEIDLFRGLQQFGVYDRSLRMTKAAEKTSERTGERTTVKAGGVPLLDPEEEARALLELLRMERVEMREQRLENVGDVAARRLELLSLSPEPVVALWSARREAIVVVEGSHQDGIAEDDLSGGIDYAVGPDRLVLVDLRARFGPRAPGGPTGLRLFAVAADTAR